MKHLLPYVLTILMLGCTTQQEATTRAVADPLVSAAVAGYVQSYGVPPALTAPLVTTLQNAFWGMLAQKQAGQPIASGAGDPAIGNPVAAKAPTTAQLAASLVALGAPQAQKLLTTP